MAPWARGLLQLCALIALAATPISQCTPSAQQGKQTKQISRGRHHIREHHVPRIIHQSWKDENVPSGFLPWQESWKRNHPGWEYR